MYFKTVLTAIAVACSTLTATAQKGLYLGVEANPGFMLEKNGYTGSSTQLKGYASLGLNASWYFSDNWALTTGAIFSKYNYGSSSDLGLMGIKSLSYLQVPVGLVCRGNGSQPVNAYFSFGITTYLMTGAHFSNVETYNSPIQSQYYSKDDLNKINIGPFAGGGAYINFSKKCSALLGAQFATGLLNVKKYAALAGGSNVTDYLTTFTLHFGFQMRLVSARPRKTTER